jgi:hypothetical protein
MASEGRTQAPASGRVSQSNPDMVKGSTALSPEPSGTTGAGWEAGDTHSLLDRDDVRDTLRYPPSRRTPNKG